MVYDGAHSSQHTNLRTLCGTQPGLLDSSQPSRLLRFPDSKLSFASFDPKTALPGGSSIPKPGVSGNLAPPKRIVIEATSNGASFWRFVPRARLEEGAQDEGVWPRVIDICGEKVQCHQEQWEIYKLDPKYHCVVYPWPKCSTVSWLEPANQPFDSGDSCSGKRSRWSSPEDGEPVSQKRARSHALDETDETSSDVDEDEDEVEDMIVDEFFSQNSKSDSGLYPSRRERIRSARLERWAKARMTYEKQPTSSTFPAEGSFSMRVDSDHTPMSRNTPVKGGPKRTGDILPEPDNDSDQMLSDRSPRGHKRARTSPLNIQKSSLRAHRGTSRNHVRSEKRRLDRFRRNAGQNRQHQQKMFTGFTFIPSESVFEEGQDEVKASSTKTKSQGSDSPGEAPQEASSREAEIAESIRKLRELEKDRPLWEEQRRKREAREHAEEQERLAKAERRRREEEQRLRQQHESAEREKRRAQQEAERLAREELRQRETRQRRQRQRWESGTWTIHRALERYRILSDEFDAAKFTSGWSITFQDIPWPVLHAPSQLTVEDVEWSAVETFFTTVKPHMRLQDYKEFVEKSHRRFHPDRWRARRIWAAVTDEVERGCLEVAANTVAQAITPIWRAMKGQ